MLVDIAKPPTSENAAIHLNPSDNVAIARVPLAAGQSIRVDGRDVSVTTAVPVGHKIALERVEPGDVLRRYGQIIGRASRLIEPGQHIHTHNVAYEEVTFDYEYPTHNLPLPTTPANCPTFLGYPREDGRAGTRNYIAVVAASNCAAHTAELIARSYENEMLPPNVDGVVSLPHGEGCGMSSGPDLAQLKRTLAGVLDHPNVSAAIVLGLGCEVNQIDHYIGLDTPRSDRLVGMTLQNSGGTRATVEAARKTIDRFIERAAAEERSEVPASKIILGLNCGGSDSFSGITANPALGYCSDLLASLAGTA